MPLPPLLRLLGVVVLGYHAHLSPGVTGVRESALHEGRDLRERTSTDSDALAAYREGRIPLSSASRGLNLDRHRFVSFRLPAHHNDAIPSCAPIATTPSTLGA